MQTYLAWRKELHSWISQQRPVAARHQSCQFVINLLTEAMSPTNSLSNPAAVKRFFETGGKSLLTASGHLAKDLVNNGGMPSQVDMDAFEVGKNLATTEGAVVFRNDVLELIQYWPISESVHERPLLIVPPQINKYYVFDLSPDKSFVQYALKNNRRSSSSGLAQPRRPAPRMGPEHLCRGPRPSHRGQPRDHRQPQREPGRLRRRAHRGRLARPPPGAPATAQGQ